MRKKLVVGMALLFAINLVVIVIAQNSKTQNETPNIEAVSVLTANETPACCAESGEEKSCCAENSEFHTNAGQTCCQVEQLIAEKKVEAKMKK